MMQTHVPAAALMAAVGCAMLSMSTGVAAQDKKPIELRYSSGAPPKGNPWVTQIERFAKHVEEESKGELKIQPFLNSALGSEQDTVQQVARGRIDMGGYASGAAALVVPEVALLVMPFYFRNVAEFDCVLDNHMTKPVAELYDKKGVKFLGWTEVGSIELFGKKPFLAPKDLNGAKAAIYANKTQSLFFSSLGASPTPLGLPEWIPAFQTGMADVVMTPITFALPSGLTKVAPVATRLGVYDSPALTLMNKATFDKLPKHLQDALVKAGERTPSSQYRAEVRGFEGVLYGMHEKAGGQIVVATQEQRDAWRKQLEPVYPKIVKETGGTSEAFFATMEAGRKACAK
ncbi:TRAP transporter substrate-binding protein [Ideonella sp. A 288]|uniref:TRAP transporter substrate-binding protein n=1 Tax=Ideonella sp. A 288 TaxID=1962181 RepID=UPI00130308AF|nr:TRAP transporter substrate-binding protein DctP [Ideonella sp. A 288]